jgi:hypothetical protein
MRWLPLLLLVLALLCGAVHADEGLWQSHRFHNPNFSLTVPVNWVVIERPEAPDLMLGATALKTKFTVAAESPATEEKIRAALSVLEASSIKNVLELSSLLQQRDGATASELRAVKSQPYVFETASTPDRIQWHAYFVQEPLVYRLSLDMPQTLVEQCRSGFEYMLQSLWVEGWPNPPATRPIKSVAAPVSNNPASAPADQKRKFAPQPAESAAGVPPQGKLALWQTDVKTFRSALATRLEEEVTPPSSQSNTSLSHVACIAALSDLLGSEVLWKLTFDGMDDKRVQFAEDSLMKGRGTFLGSTKDFIVLNFTPAPDAVAAWRSCSRGTTITCRARISNLTCASRWSAQGRFAGWMPIIVLDEARIAPSQN